MIFVVLDDFVIIVTCSWKIIFDLVVVVVVVVVVVAVVVKVAVAVAVVDGDSSRSHGGLIIVQHSVAHLVPASFLKKKEEYTHNEKPHENSPRNIDSSNHYHIHFARIPSC